MHIQDRIGKGLQHRRPDETHEAGEADQDNAS